jgi:hypothetical protein
MKENYGINWKRVEMNLSQDTDVNLVTTMRLLWLSMPFLVSVVTPVALTFKAKTAKTIEMTQLLDSDDELTSGSYGNGRLLVMMNLLLT